jgi:hypothetical protein
LTLVVPACLDSTPQLWNELAQMVWGPASEVFHSLLKTLNPPLCHSPNRALDFQAAFWGMDACAAGSVAKAIAPDPASAAATRIAGHRRSDLKKERIVCLFQ